MKNWLHKHLIVSSGLNRRAESWGRAGSGILYYCKDDGTVLLLLRSQEVMDPGTWGIPGGAVKGTEGYYDDDEEAPDFSDEELYASAEAEVGEEMGYVPSGQTVGRTSTSKGNFTYTTFVVEISSDEKANVESSIQLNWESDDFGWFRIDKLPLGVHPGVEESVLQFMGEEGKKAKKAGVWWHGDRSKRSSFHGQVMDRQGGESRNALGPGSTLPRTKDRP